MAISRHLISRGTKRDPTLETPHLVVSFLENPTCFTDFEISHPPSSHEPEENSGKLACQRSSERLKTKGWLGEFSVRYKTRQVIRCPYSLWLRGRLAEKLAKVLQVVAVWG